MINNLDFTFIGKQSELKGEFTFGCNTKIAGNVEGIVKITNNAKLSLEIGSHFKGKLFTHDLEIYGDFLGEIESTGNIVVYPTGNVEGKIKAKSIEVFPGANLNINGHTVQSFSEI
jgi:cytoskeletal protein CcmA (bactofilin family)